jgi:solute carrier family 66, member 2
MKITVFSYWTFLAYLFVTLFVIHVFLPFISRTDSYINLLGFVGLTVEALLPLPQIVANQRSRSCKGFRLSVLASWLIGDVMKISYLFYSQDMIPLAFRLCAIFQCICDCYLGVQYWIFGSDDQEATGSLGGHSPQWRGEKKDIRLT